MQNIFSLTVVVLTAAYPIHFLCRRDRKSLPLALSLALLAAAALEFFDLTAFRDPGNFFLWKKCSLGVEAMLPPVWLWFSLTYARQNELGSITLLQRIFLAVSPLFAVSILVLPVDAFFYSPDFSDERVLFLGTAGFLFYFFLFVYLVISLVNLETTLLSTSHASRWKIKYELLGAGVLLASMVFYYSQGLLYRTIAMHMSPVRTTMLFVAVMLMAYSRLKRGNGVAVRVSQQLAYKSLVLLAVGVYLTGLGLMGEGMKYFGTGFQRTTAIILAFGAGLGLLIVLLSETMKRKALVFIHRNFYQNKYDYRTQWLQFTDHLSASRTSDELLQAIVSGFSETFGMGCGALFILDAEQEAYRLAAGIGMESSPVAFCKSDPAVHVLTEKMWITDLRDGNMFAGDDQRAFFTANRAAFVVPLAAEKGVDGFIMLGKSVNEKETYDYEDFDLMKTLARQATSTLLNLRLSEQLARAREMEAAGKVSAFVMHDLKNLASVMSLMLTNAREHISVPEFQGEMLTSLGATVEKMTALISRLKNLPVNDTLQRAPVDLLQLAHDTAALVKGGELQVSGTPVITEGNRSELQKVALNLMLNAVEASAGKRPVTVEVGADDLPFLRVKDEGSGVPDDFLRNHLFTPFKTTKANGLGIGLYQCKQIVEAHGGRIEVTTHPNKGSVFTVRLPKTNALSL